MSNADRAVFDELVTTVGELRDRIEALERRVLVTQERLDIVADRVMPSDLSDEFYDGHEAPVPARNSMARPAKAKV